MTNEPFWKRVVRGSWILHDGPPSTFNCFNRCSGYGKRTVADLKVVGLRFPKHTTSFLGSGPGRSPSFGPLALHLFGDFASGAAVEIDFAGTERMHPALESTPGSL